MNLHTLLLLVDLILTCPIKWEKVLETPFTYVESFTYASSFNYPNNNDRMIARLSQKAAAIVCKLDVRFVERKC